MNKFKLLLIINLIYPNIHSLIYHTLPKNSDDGKYFLLPYGQEYESWGNPICVVGATDLLSFMYYDVITLFLKANEENIVLKNHIVQLKTTITQLEIKMDLLLAKFDIEGH